MFTRSVWDRSEVTMSWTQVSSSGGIGLLVECIVYCFGEYASHGSLNRANPLVETRHQVYEIRYGRDRLVCSMLCRCSSNFCGVRLISGIRYWTAINEVVEIIIRKW